MPRRPYSRSSVYKGIFRRPVPVKNRKRWIGTKTAAVVVSSSRRRQAQII